MKPNNKELRTNIPLGERIAYFYDACFPVVWIHFNHGWHTCRKYSFPNMSLLVQYAIVKLLLSRQLQEVSVAVFRRPIVACLGNHVETLSLSLPQSQSFLSHHDFLSGRTPPPTQLEVLRTFNYYIHERCEHATSLTYRVCKRAMRCRFVSRCRQSFMKFVRLCVKSYHFMVTFTFKNPVFLSPLQVKLVVFSWTLHFYSM